MCVIGNTRYFTMRVMFSYEVFEELYANSYVLFTVGRYHEALLWKCPS